MVTRVRGAVDLTFDTVADMITADLKIGDTVETNRRNTITKTGGAVYEIFESGDAVSWLNKTAGAATIENPIYAYTLDNGLIAVARNVIVMNYLEGLRANPQDYGVVYGAGLSQQSQQDNSGFLQDCFNDADEVEVRGEIETFGEVRLHNGMRVEGQTALIGSIVGFHPTEPTIADNTRDNPNAQSNNVWNVTLRELGIRSINNDAIYLTPYQCMIERCRITAENGAGIRHHDGGYQVENKYQNNYFFSCLTGISALGGFRSATDEYIVDNYFFGNGIQDTCIEIINGSGSLYRGNHCYGGAIREFIRLSGGLNVSLVDNYFEGMNNPRIFLSHGNPGSFSVVANKFWQGDGAATDYNGDQSSIISVAFSDFNDGKSAFSGNVFESGVNNVPVFNVLNGGFDDARGIAIQFDKSNTISGSYWLAVRGASGTAVQTWMIQSDHPEFFLYDNAQNRNYPDLTASEVIAEASGSATTFPVLPSNPIWLRNKTLKINNTAPNMTMDFSSSGGTLVLGLNPVPALTRIQIIERGGDYFIMKN